MRLIASLVVLNRHMRSDFRLVTYYGAGRQTCQSVIKNSHVVLTTYNVLTSEWKSRKSVTLNGKFNLLSLMWHRIVLDEGEMLFIEETPRNTPLTSSAISL